MVISGKQDFIRLIQSFNIKTEYVIIKPNWVGVEKGNYTEPEILAWLFEALPNSKKIVVESYIPSRGLKYEPSETFKTDLEGGKKFWDFYKKQDKYYLKSTGIDKVLEKFNAEYINITDECWKGEVVDPKIIEEIVRAKHKDIYWKNLYSYIPKKLFNIKDEATLISLAKIKLEEGNKNIIISLSLKNIFGLIPSPSRKDPYHQDNHSLIPRTIIDINKIYQVLFPNSLWINEGIFSLVKNYCEDGQFYEQNKNLIFASRDPKEADTAVCEEFNINPSQIPYLN
ncbi:MAG: DUF362 domain-containing protein [Patescibacteria group bacterium]|nr:DUF362 domain-containing protein [Patescibacteria group bacterium]